MVHIYIFHYIINPLIIIFIGKILYGKTRNLSFPAVFLAFYLLTHYVRAVDVFINDYQNWRFLISIWIVPFLFLFGVGISLIGWQHDPIKIKKAFYSIQTSRFDTTFKKYITIISVCLVILPVIFVLDKGVSSVPIFYLISNPGDAVQSMHLRLNGLKSNISPFLTNIYSYSRAFVYPLHMAILTLFYMDRQIKKNHIVIVGLSSIVFASMTASKAPLAVVLFSMALAFYFGTTDSKSRFKVIVAMFLSVFIPALLYPLMYGSEAGSTIIVALENLWRRISLVPSRATAAYFSIFNIFDKTGFASNRITSFIFNKDYQPHASFVYNYISGGNTFQGGLVNASYIGSFYADWGMVGVVFGTILVGVIVGQLQVFFDRFHNDRVGTGFRAFTMIGMMYLMLTNFYSVALGRGFLSAPILLFIFAYKKVFYRRTKF